MLAFTVLTAYNRGTKQREGFSMRHDVNYTMLTDFYELTKIGRAHV